MEIMSDICPLRMEEWELFFVLELVNVAWSIFMQTPTQHSLIFQTLDLYLSYTAYFQNPIHCKSLTKRLKAFKAEVIRKYLT